MRPQDEIKNQIREKFKKGAEVPTSLGPAIVTGAELGQGGSAVVLPVDFAGVPAAAKFLVDLESADRLTRFRNEYARVVTLRIPEVVSQYHYAEVVVEGRAVPMILMERAQGTLGSVIKSLTDGRSRAHLVNRLLADVLPGLEALHAAAVIHRDLKPENILVRAKGEVLVLADFGIAHFEKSTLTKKDDRLANYKYAAPEQVAGDARSVTPATDFFAFGQILHEVLFGEVLRGKHQGRARDVLLELAYLDSPLTALLSQDPRQRPQAVSELRALMDHSRRLLSTQSDEALSRRALEVFASAVAEAVPGSRTLAEVRDPVDIARIGALLADACEEGELWWTRGHSDSAIGVLRAADWPEDPTRWLLDACDMRIAALWVWQPRSGNERQFMILETAPQEPSGVYGSDHSEDGCEEVGLLGDRYIRREEYDDGFALIDGTVVPSAGAQLRVRVVRRQFYFLVSRLSPLLDTDNAGDLLETLIERWETGGRVPSEADIEPLLRLPRSCLSRMMG